MVRVVSSRIYLVVELLIAEHLVIGRSVVVDWRQSVRTVAVK